MPVYVDEMASEAIDLLSAKREVDNRESNYQSTNVGLILESDDKKIMIYKMYEAMRHLNDRISEFSKSETAFGRNIKKFTDLPEVISEFINVPS